MISGQDGSEAAPERRTRSAGWRDPHSRLQAGLWFLLFVVIAGVGRWQLEAQVQDFGAFEDEASHMVTSAMMRAYATSFDPTNPIEFIESYYLHYPKVASGQWPPVLHAFFGALMIPFGVQRWVVLLGSVLIAALAASALRALSMRAMPAWLAGWLGILFLAVPLVQELSATPMTELLIGALGAFGVLQYAKYLKSGRARHALWYGLITLLAVWTKGNGTGLIVVALLGPFFAGRPNRWITRGTVLSGLFVGLLGGAWYMATMHFSQTTWAGQDRSLGEYSTAALRFYTTELWLVMGSLASGLAILGWITGMLERESRDRTAAVTAWMIGLACCHLFIRTGIEPRHVASALPVAFLLSGQGALWLWKQLGWAQGGRAVLAGGLISLGIGCQAWTPATSNHSGYQQAVAEILAQPEAQAAPWLVASDALGEGLVVAEAVLHDPRHERLQVLRASKVLAENSWLGEGYRILHESEADLKAFLQHIPVGYVLFDRAQWRKQWYPHHRQLLNCLRHPDGTFERVATFPVIRDGIYYPEALEVYRQVGFESLPRHPLTLDQVLRYEARASSDPHKGPQGESEKPEPQPEPQSD